jgi:hypothetical protein
MIGNLFGVRMCGFGKLGISSEIYQGVCARLKGKHAGMINTRLVLPESVRPLYGPSSRRLPPEAGMFLGLWPRDDSDLGYQINSIHK